MTLLAGEIDLVRRLEPVKLTGTVATLRGLTLLVDDLPAPVGSLVGVRTGNGFGPAVRLGEVVGFADRRAIVMLLGQTGGIRVGDRVDALQNEQCVRVGRHMLGRIVNGLGEPIDGRGMISGGVARPLYPSPVTAMHRRRIAQPIHTGVRAVDLMTTLGRGQRMGIFAGPGVGKSTLLGSFALGASSDVNVIALIGERGREVREFIDEALGEDGLGRSIVVVATGDESPLLRVRAAMVACTIAEFFRDEGGDVLLMMDSVTRFAHAQRQIGLSVGEPPATKGYTPSVFAQLALMLERAGAVEPGPGTRGGSITGLYTVLVEGDDMTEPISDAARGILDGHLMLSRRLAQRGQYPAIDVLDSISRVADTVCDEKLVASRRKIRELMARYAQIEELVQINAYARGSDAETDVAIEYHPKIRELFAQGPREFEGFDDSRSRLVKLALQAGEDVRTRLARREAA